MGMSASQARLLSITARLTNNEFRSQTITNSKLRLAEKSSEASQEYMDALNSQQLMFGVYDDNGNYTKQDLTPALIYDYAPLKNQYALINTAGKMLVSNQDAENFEKSNTLHEFLGKYNLISDVDLINDYEADYAKYLKLMEDYEKELGDYNKEMDEYSKKLAEYNASLNRPDLYTAYSSIVRTSDTVVNSGAQGHYYRALHGDTSCFLHTLNVLMDYDGTNLSTKTFQTSLENTTVTLDGADGGMQRELTTEEKTKMVEISKALDSCYCDGDDDLNTEGKQNILKAKFDAGETPTNLEILQSDYINNGDGTYSLKTLQQKCIDMYYIIKQELVTDATEMKNILTNLTEGDMKGLTTDHPGNPPQKPNPPPEPEKPEFDISLNDKDKAQWYINLWHYMNGSETANKIGTKVITYSGKDETVHWVADSEKSGKGGTYEVFEDLSLYKSSDWLQFALEHGMVTMYQAQYNNPAQDSGKVSELTSEGVTWTSIIYTNASDITQQDDETAIAIAEVKYKNAVTEIENQDKKYDQDLKKLDTEHSALQTEYDSIKEVIGKNVDRSFKAFS